MTVKELKQRMKEYPGRYSEVQYYSAKVKEGEVVKLEDGDQVRLGVVIMKDYPKSGWCVIDIEMKERIEEGSLKMENWMLFLANLISNVKHVEIKSIDTEDDNRIKGEMVQIELPVYGLTFIGDNLADAVKKIAKFVGDSLVRMSDLMKESDLITSAKKVLLDVARKN